LSSCLLLRSPRLRPLPPYTRLFRSVDQAVAIALRTGIRRVPHEWGAQHHTAAGAVRRDGAAPADPPPCLTVHPELRAQLVDQRRDRKSTRLNSSHVSISYAVFCFKR